MGTQECCPTRVTRRKTYFSPFWLFSIPTITLTATRRWNIIFLFKNFILLLFIDNLVREQVYFVLFSPCTLRFQLKFAEKIVFPLSVLNVIYAFYNNQSRNHLIKTWWHICLLHQALLAAPSKAALYLVQKMIHRSAHSDWRWLRFVFINV